MPVVTLLTDFGLSDPFVGEMKGVLLKLAPYVHVVDLTHGIAPGRVREASWILTKAWEQFPEGTCHVAVVDPGVGAGRRPLAIRAGGHSFVGPDNGILGAAFTTSGEAEIREIELRDADHTRRGTTFDGRDLFAPAAARLATGMPFTQVGPEVHDPVGLPPWAPVKRSDDWEVEIIRIDRFGNLVTTAEAAFLREQFGEDWRRVRVRAGDRRVEFVRLAYDEVEAGEALLSIGGSGTLEISVNRGSAAALLGLDAGDRIRVKAPREEESPADESDLTPAKRS